MNSIMLTIDTTGNPFKHLAAEGNIDATSDGTVQFFNLIRDWYSTMIVTGAVGLVCVFMILFIKMMIIKNSKDRVEIKTVLSWKIAIAFVICCLPILFPIVCAICEKILV